MNLCWCKYKKKPIIIVSLGIYKGNLIALKVQEPPLDPVISNSSISKLKSISEKFMRMDLKDQISEIKNLIPEWNKIYRTYKLSHLEILKQQPIGSS